MDVLSNKADVEIKEYSSNEPEVEPPRLGRRESEPHSEEVCYMRNVLKDNYPDHRVLWDLHHYFYHDGEEIDIVFDISFFLEFKTDGPISLMILQRIILWFQTWLLMFYQRVLG